jgi:hypothetical protein
MTFERSWLSARLPDGLETSSRQTVFVSTSRSGDIVWKTALRDR